MNLHVIGDGTSTIRTLISTFYDECRTQDKFHYKKTSERNWDYILGQINKENAKAVNQGAFTSSKGPLVDLGTVIAERGDGNYTADTQPPLLRLNKSILFIVSLSVISLP